MSKAIALILKSGETPIITRVTVDTALYSTPMSFSEKQLGTKYVEIVRPVRMNGKYGFYVSETGLIERAPMNYYGCALYGTEKHRQVIAGDVVIVRLDRKGDACWLQEEDEIEVRQIIAIAESRFLQGITK